MASTLQSTSDCCTPCSGTATVQTPGPSGTDGDDGSNGTNGVSAFTTVSTAFDMPAEAEAEDVTVTVGDSTWMTPNQIIYIQNCGWMKVMSKPDSTSVVLRNPEVTASSTYSDNKAEDTEVVSGNTVSPGGLQGPAGSAAAAGADASLSYWTVTSEAGLTGEIAIDLLADGPVQHVSGTPSIATLLKAIEALAANGIVARTSASTAAARTITGTASEIDVTNGDGVSGNPTLALDAGVYRSGGTDVALADGGTGASTAAAARTNLGITLSTIGVVYYEDRQTTPGTAGGNALAVTWNPRPLVEVYDSGTVGSLATPNLTLGAGTYRVNIWGVAYQVGKHQIQLKNTTDGTTAVYGSSAESNVANGDGNTISMGHGRFTIISSKVFQLQHYTTTQQLTNGLGSGVNAIYEVYAGLEIVQESE